MGRSGALWLLVFLLGCHQPDPLRGLSPRAQLDEVLLDFGGVPVGETAELAVHLRNVSNTPFHAKDAERLLNNPSFSVELGNNTILPGEVRQVQVRFHPLTEGPLE